MLHTCHHEVVQWGESAPRRGFHHENSAGPNLKVYQWAQQHSEIRQIHPAYQIAQETWCIGVVPAGTSEY